MEALLILIGYLRQPVILPAVGPTPAKVRAYDVFTAGAITGWLRLYREINQSSNYHNRE